MKKDITWAKKEIKDLTTEKSQNYPHDELIEKEIVLGILNQIDKTETVADVITTFWKSSERLKEVMNMEVEELGE